ncbi:MAG: CHAT domain-containing protein [Candidatus Eisenbacteria bacterium]
MRDANDRYLAERFFISYSSSASLFTLMCERANLRGAPSSRHALLIGDPPFSDQQLAGMLKHREPSEPEISESLLASNEFREGTLLRDALAGNRELLQTLPRLTWTHLEVLRIAGLLPGATVLLGPEASEEGISRLSESGALNGYDTIHLATHALRDVRLPQFAAFVLSQVGTKDAPPKLGSREELESPRGALDGLLMPEEIAALHLKADLVTLSGCATTGFRELGAYVGLSDAFLRAGASTTVASLWRVEDRATSLLMQRFYSSLAPTAGGAPPMRKDEALRDAKLWLRDYVDEDGRTPYRHPAYWSSFVLVGDPGR